MIGWMLAGANLAVGTANIAVGNYALGSLGLVVAVILVMVEVSSR